MAGRTFLNTPGPTNTPDRILRAMHVPMEDHRSPDFPELTLPLFTGLKEVFKTEDGEAFIFPSSGTGAWEAVLTNTLSPGDKVLSVRFGQFSHLWIDMAQRLSLDVEVQDLTWGDAPSPARIGDALAADPGHAIKAVFLVQNETATGVTTDVAAVRAAMDAANHPALLFIDGVSSIASVDFRMDEWGVDGAVSGSQKGFMLPPGLGFAVMSPKAVEAEAAVRGRDPIRRCYFDFADHRAQNKNGYFPYTPPIPMLYGLRESLAMLREEGLENVFARHRYLARGVQAAVLEGWGMTLCASDPARRSDTVSAVMVPADKNGAEVIARAYERYQLALGAGLSKVAGKLFRIGHVGDNNELMLLAAIAGSELAMRDLGFDVKLGGGVAAAQAFYAANAPEPSEREAALV